MQKTIIGIDISAKTLDICVMTETALESFAIENNSKKIASFLKKHRQESTIIGMENTGRYNHFLYAALAPTAFEVYVINPLHLKKSMGLARGKNDRVDAERICRFLQKHHEELPTWKPDSKTVDKIKLLLTERELRVKIKSQLLSNSQSYGYVKHTGLDKKVTRFNESLIADIEAQIKKIETLIEEAIKEDEQLLQKYQWIQSVPGVGKVLAWMMIVKTQGFTLLTDARKMACYAGVAPFDYQSGASVKRKPKVSVFADKRLKKILHLAAMSAIRLKNDLQEYYQRKVADGKNKMSVLNAVRNKIIHRIFATIKNKACYKIDLAVS